MKQHLDRTSRGFAVSVAGLTLGTALIFAAKAAADPCDMRWTSGAYKGTVSECSTNATAGLAKAGFDNVGTRPRTSYTSVWGYHGKYYALVLCTKSDTKTTYSQMVIGPTGDELQNLYTAMDKDFK